VDKMPIEYVIALIIGISLTWLIVILALAKFSKLCLQFSKFTKNTQDNLLDMGANIHKMQLASREMLIEKRRNNKLVAELIEAQKNYNPLNGLEYELVEEEEEVTSN
jgi:hypothetical protein